MKLGDYELGPGSEHEGIYTGDARELAQGIPDESVDLIFTDPVYQNIDDYRWLAETAARVLKPDSACLVFYGIGYAPQTMQALIEGGLSFRWQMVHYMPGQNQRGAYRTFSNWKAMLWMEKGTRHPDHHIRDLILDRSVRVLPSGANHRWTKNADTVAYYLTAFCLPGATIFDPLTGSGTVPAVCKMLSRRYLAFEIEPDVAELARDRVRQTQPPLPGLTLETQGALNLTKT